MTPGSPALSHQQLRLRSGGGPGPGENLQQTGRVWEARGSAFHMFGPAHTLSSSTWRSGAPDLFLKWFHLCKSSTFSVEKKIKKIWKIIKVPISTTSSLTLLKCYYSKLLSLTLYTALATHVSAVLFFFLLLVSDICVIIRPLLLDYKHHEVRLFSLPDFPAPRMVSGTVFVEKLKVKNIPSKAIQKQALLIF